MKCPQCGAEVPVNRLYCDQCGAQLEHDLAEVQATVEEEIRQERARATARTARWLLGVALAVFVAGLLFRRAYKDLPPNDIVAFVQPPAARLSALETVVISDFGVEVPVPRRETPVKRPRRETAQRRALDQAYALAAVEVRTKGGKESTAGLLVGDIALRVIPEGGQAEVVGVGEIRSLKALPGGNWELATCFQPKAYRVAIPAAANVKLLVLPRGADAPSAIPLLAVTEIKPR